MAPQHSYGPAGTGDSTDDEDRPFISAEFSEKKKAVLGTSSFNKVMGFVNVILALVLAICLALLAVTETQNRRDVTVTSMPYCMCSSASISITLD